MVTRTPASKPDRLSKAGHGAAARVTLVARAMASRCCASLHTSGSGSARNPASQASLVGTGGGRIDERWQMIDLTLELAEEALEQAQIAKQQVVAVTLAEYRRKVRQVALLVEIHAQLRQRGRGLQVVVESRRDPERLRPGAVEGQEDVAGAAPGGAPHLPAGDPLRGGGAERIARGHVELHVGAFRELDVGVQAVPEMRDAVDRDRTAAEPAFVAEARIRLQRQRRGARRPAQAAVHHSDRTPSAATGPS